MTATNPTPASRRRFLGLALAGACGCLLPWPARLLAAPSAMPREQRLTASFAGTAEGMARMLAGKLGEDQARIMAREAREAFAARLGDITDIGPDNPNQESLEQAACLAALRAPMARRRMPAWETGRLFYDLCWREWSERPREEVLAQGAAYFSPANQKELARWAKRTRRRLHPGDWVAEVSIRGQGQDLEIRKDYLECGALKLFRAFGVPEVAPFFCLNDFTTSRFMDTGLSRTKTLAQRDEVCNFRYRPGREVTQDWDTELPLLKSRGFL